MPVIPVNDGMPERQRINVTNVGLTVKQGEEAAALGSGSALQKESGLGTSLLQVAWLAILLGLVIETILLLLTTVLGTIPGIKPVAADLVQKVSWSVIVCVGLAFGKVASKTQPVFMGLAGLFAAPAAFEVARTLHKSVTFALKLAEPGAGFASPLLLACLKGLEYAALGVLLAWIARRSSAGVISHAGVGLIVGLVFGGAIVSSLYSVTPGPVPMAKVLPQFVNELIFPVGCSLALFAADVLGKRVSQ